MATTMAQIASILDDVDLNYVTDDDSDSILLGFGIDPEMATYRDKDGDPHLRVVVAVAEKGEFLNVFAPFAWSLDGCEHKAAVFEAFTLIQSRYKMLRFDYDPADGEVRPNVELPLEDATLTATQFHRVMHALIDGIGRFDPVIRKAMETGTVSLDLASRPCAGPSDPTTPGDIDSLLRLIDETDGLDALEDLAGGTPLLEGPEPGEDRQAG